MSGFKQTKHWRERVIERMPCVNPTDLAECLTVAIKTNSDLVNYRGRLRHSKHRRLFNFIGKDGSEFQCVVSDKSPAKLTFITLYPAERV